MGTKHGPVVTNFLSISLHARYIYPLPLVTGGPADERAVTDAGHDARAVGGYTLRDPSVGAQRPLGPKRRKWD